MLDLSIDKIKRSYDTVKRLSLRNFNNKDFDSYIDNADIAAKIAQSFNWIYKDEDLESQFGIIAKNFIIEENLEFSSISHKVVFYDEIGSIACLSIQYLRALMYFNYEILYIFESSDRKLASSIVTELNDYGKSKIINIDSSCTNKIEIIKSLYKEILAFQPEKAILETPAEGAFGAILWNALPQIKRYRIVPGDHHFYLGVSCSDYFLEFRNYGATVSIEKRGIKKSQILLQPYYPLVDKHDFKGWPIDVTDKIIILTASAPYKIYGENDAYFTIVKHLLDNNPQIVVFFAGTGFIVPIKKFIKRNHLQDRFILLGYRTDLNECIANCDIYLCSYPISGGLTTQLAAHNAKPILSYTNKDIIANKVDDVVESVQEDIKRITFYELEHFYRYADKLINSPAFRKEEGLNLFKKRFTIENFNSCLKSNLEGLPTLSKEYININYERFTDLYIEQENKYNPVFKFLLTSKYSFRMIFLFYYILPSVFFSKLYCMGIFNSFYQTTRKFIQRRCFSSCANTIFYFNK